MNFEKAPGNDSLPIEVSCSLESEESLNLILGYFNEALATHGRRVHAGLEYIIITTLFKKGNPSFCDNYRTLSLFNHIRKVLEKLI
jgi:hypothetical protein